MFPSPNLKPKWSFTLRGNSLSQLFISDLHLWPSFRDLIPEYPPAFHIEYPPLPEPFVSKYFMLLLVRATHQGPVVRMLVSANPGWNFNPGFFFFLSRALSWIILNLLFELSCLSSNFTLTLGYLNPLFEQPSLDFKCWLYYHGNVVGDKFLLDFGLKFQH